MTCTDRSAAGNSCETMLAIARSMTWARFQTGMTTLMLGTAAPSSKMSEEACDHAIRGRAVPECRTFSDSPRTRQYPIDLGFQRTEFDETIAALFDRDGPLGIVPQG